MVTISENKASIEHFDSLVSVSNSLIVFFVRRKKVSIMGERLRIVLFTNEEVWIKGLIRQVNFDER